jgi:anti-anti-sigma factor
MPATLPIPATLSTAHRNRPDNYGAVFATRWLSSSTAVIAAHGEIDAANAVELADYTMRHTVHANRLVLDLTGVDFFGTAGFSAVHTVNVQCIGDGATWVMVPSRAVSRLLRICDPDSTLPSRDTVSAALSALQGKSPLLQLVTKSR